METVGTALIVKQLFIGSLVITACVGVHAEMLALLKSAELHTYYSAWVADRDENPVAAAAMAKLVATEAANSFFSASSIPANP